MAESIGCWIPKVPEKECMQIWLCPCGHQFYEKEWFKFTNVSIICPKCHQQQTVRAVVRCITDSVVQ